MTTPADGVPEVLYHAGGYGVGGMPVEQANAMAEIIAERDRQEMNAAAGLGKSLSDRTATDLDRLCSMTAALAMVARSASLGVSPRDDLVKLGAHVVAWLETLP